MSFNASKTQSYNRVTDKTIDLDLATLIETRAIDQEEWDRHCRFQEFVDWNWFLCSQANPQIQWEVVEEHDYELSTTHYYRKVDPIWDEYDAERTAQKEMANW